MSTHEASPDLVGQIGDRLRELSEFYVEVIAAVEAIITHAEAQHQRYQQAGSDVAGLYAATAAAMRSIKTQLTTAKTATAQLMAEPPRLRGRDSDEEAAAEARKLAEQLQHQHDLRSQAQRTLWDAQGRIAGALERQPSEFEPLDDALMRLGNFVSAARDTIEGFVTSAEGGPKR